MPASATLQQHVPWQCNCYRRHPPSAACSAAAFGANLQRSTPAGLYVGGIEALEHLQELGITHVVVSLVGRCCRCVVLPLPSHPAWVPWWGCASRRAAKSSSQPLSGSRPGASPAYCFPPAPCSLNSSLSPLPDTSAPNPTPPSPSSILVLPSVGAEWRRLAGRAAPAAGILPATRRGGRGHGRGKPAQRAARGRGLYHGGPAAQRPLPRACALRAGCVAQRRRGGGLPYGCLGVRDGRGGGAGPRGCAGHAALCLPRRRPQRRLHGAAAAVPRNGLLPGRGVRPVQALPSATGEPRPRAGSVPRAMPPLWALPCPGPQQQAGAPCLHSSTRGPCTKAARSSRLPGLLSQPGSWQSASNAAPVSEGFGGA